MTPHPDFEPLDLPQSFELGRFTLAMLTATDLDDDYTSVVQSATVLVGLFGDTWPTDLTRAEDETDLHWHHREFLAKRSFAWVIRDEFATYIGCAYLFPDIATRGQGQAVYWMTDTATRLQQLREFGPLYIDWLTAQLPKGYTLSQRCND